MTKIIDVRKLRRRVDFAILAVRDDEFSAIATRFPERASTSGGLQTYAYVETRNRHGETISVAIGRQPDQGHSPAQYLARDMIDDLNPRWLILLGVCGGFADSEFSLGDVLLANNLIDFSVTAEIDGKPTEFRPVGAMMHAAVERLLSALPDWAERLDQWNTPIRLRKEKPNVAVPEIGTDLYFGPTAFREKVRDELLAHFPLGQPPRLPKFSIGTLATSNTLLKDASLLAEWKRIARQITHVEMEAGGVIRAVHGRQLPFLSVRGVSDIVGFRRDDVWLKYACETAASFTCALLHELPQSHFDRNYRPLWRDQARRAFLGLGSRIKALGSSLWYFITSFRSAVCREGAATATVEDVLKAFAATAKPLLSKVVDEKRRLPIPQLPEVLSLIDTPTEGVVCVLGTPGSGKTALLAHVARQAAEKNVATFAVRADLILSENTLQNWGRDTFGFDLSAIDAVRLIANRQPTVVIVDQLDAVAGNVDLKSSVLDSLLRFISDCARLKSVSLICSCRRFDFYNDARFRALNAEVIELEPPAWESVKSLLNHLGVSAVDTWSPDARRMISQPQSLTVFLRRFEAIGNGDSTTSYHQMLEEEWERLVVTAEESQLVASLTSFLTNEENIFAPSVTFDRHRSARTALVRKGVLSIEQGKLGFSHQTLLEHAKAREFVKQNGSLVEFVIRRQSGVFVRPTLLAVLGYLRDVHPAKYAIEMSGLLTRELRLHIRYLVIEWVGQQSEPLDIEVDALRQLLRDPECQLRVLIAIRGRTLWFDQFADTELVEIMTGAASQQWSVENLFLSLLGTRRSKILELIEKHWLGDYRNDTSTWRVLHEVKVWDAAPLSLVERLLQRAPSERANEWLEQHTVELIAQERPEKAIDCLAIVLKRWDEIRDHAGGAATFRPLEQWRGWSFLPDVAAAMPSHYLRIIWPLVAHVCDITYSGEYSSVLRSYGGFLIGLDDDERERPVLRSVARAIESCAATDPVRFQEITIPTWESESAVTHRLLHKGMAVTGICDTILDYLAGDERRLFVGSYSEGESAVSIVTIKHAASISTAQQIERLVAIIRSSSKYRRDIDLSEDHLRWDREARLRLLSAIGDERLSAETLAFVTAERAALPDWDRPETPRGRFGRVRHRSPVSAEELLSATSDSLGEAIERARNQAGGDWQWSEGSSEWVEPGGEESVGVEIATIASTDPERAVELTKQLVARRAIKAATAAMESKSMDSMSDQRLFELTQLISENGIVDERLRGACAGKLYDRLRKHEGLPDQIIAILSAWLQTPVARTEGEYTDVEVAEGDDTVPTNVSSVLWGHGAAFSIPHRLWSLMAITYGLLQRDPPAYSEWIRIVSATLQQDQSKSLWIAFSRELKFVNLANCDTRLGVQLIRDVFSACSELIFTTSGTRLTAILRGLMPPEWTRSQLELLRSATKYQARQAYGELLVLIASESSSGWASDLLDQELAAIVAAGRPLHDDAIATGFAFAAANLWNGPESKSFCAKVLASVIPAGTEAVSEAVQQIFWSEDGIDSGSESLMVLSALARNPTCFGKMRTDELVPQLVDLTPKFPDVILNVVEGLVAHSQRDYSFMFAGADIVEIAITLQRFPSTRDRGLSLLEELLKLGLDAAFNSLRDIDSPVALAPRRREDRAGRGRRRRRS